LSTFFQQIQKFFLFAKWKGQNVHPCAVAQHGVQVSVASVVRLRLLNFALLFVEGKYFDCIFSTPVVAFSKKTVAHNPLANRCPKPTISLPRGGVFAQFVDGFNPLSTQI